MFAFQGDSGGRDVASQSCAQTVTCEEAVENIQSRMQDASLSERNSASNSRENMTDDMVDAGVKHNGSRANARLSTSVKGIPLPVYRRVCLMLNVKSDVKWNDFRMLGEKVGLDRNEIDFIAQTAKNPTDEILKIWSTKLEATVGKLIEILKGKDLERMDVVKDLEDWVNEK